MGQENASTSTYIKVVIVLLFMFGFRFLSPLGDITPYGMAVLGILIGAILGWSFDGKCMLHTSLLALVALATTDYPGGINAICTNLMASSSLIVMCMGMVMVGGLVDAGVDNYLIAKVMNISFAKGRPWVITFILVFAPYILSIFIMNSALILFLLPVYAKVFKEAGYKVGDKYVLHVFIGAMVTACASMYIFPFLGMPLAFGGMVQAYTGVMWTYAEYMMTVTVFTFVLAAGYTVFMRLIRCDASRITSLDLNVFGDPKAPVSRYQKSVLICMLLFIVGSVIISFGGMLDTPVTNFMNQIGVFGWMFVILAIMMIVRVDGKRLLNLPVATAKGFSWDLILLVASATLVGGALTSEASGVGVLLTKLAAPLLTGLNAYGVAAVLFILVLLATNFCNNMAVMMIGFALIGSLIAGGLAVNGCMLAAGTIIFSQLGYLLPSSSMWGAILHKAELVTPMAVYKNVLLALLYIVIVTLVVFIPLCLVVF